MANTAPASRVDDWVETVLFKLSQTRRVAAHVKAAAVIDGGDFFHIKSPSRTPHELIRRVADHHADYPCPVYCTPGNHDSVYGNYDYLGQQPLGVLYSTGVFRRLYDEHEARFEKDGVTVRVVGIPYHGTSYEMERFHRIERGDEDYLVVVAHVLASQGGGSMFEGEDIVSYHDLKDHPADVFCFGHWHKDQGVVDLYGKRFINIGSLTRGALVQDNLQRRPACCLLTFTTEGIQVQVVRLNVAAAEDVFDLDGRVRQEARAMTMDAFVESLRETLVATGDEPLESAIERADVPDEVRERTLSYLERA